MILLLTSDATHDEIAALKERLANMGVRVRPYEQEGKPALALIGDEERPIAFDKLRALPHVDGILPFKKPYKLADRELHPESKTVRVGDLEIGGENLAIIAGPCSIESEEQIHAIAKAVKAAGANILRGGAFKPRTSPYAFQGIEEKGLAYMQAAGQKYGLLTISEVMDTENIERVANYVDILQVGSRNMQNFSLLKRLGEQDRPVLIKRGASATYQDLLMAAEYVLNGGNEKVILCERGIRTFETYTRNTLDLSAVPILKTLSHLPVIVDPSHGTGRRELVQPMARASIAAGADGIMVEVHTQPDYSISDAQQSIDPDQFAHLVGSLPSLGGYVKIT